MVALMVERTVDKKEGWKVALKVHCWVATRAELRVEN
jgi:hypothetical protein